MKNILMSFLLTLPLLSHSTDFATIEKLNGCYLVDYSYSEIKALSTNYQIDSRVYDSSSKFNVKELIKTVRKGANEIRLQHFMFATDKETGEVLFRLRHHGEIWQKQPNFLYEYNGLGKYTPVSSTNTWNRIVTSLDDGLRYHCPGEWQGGEYPRFTCSALSPIPGRETRDMGRKDYNTMDRTSEINIFSTSWLEKQTNKKINMTELDTTDLALEVGKHWYARLPDSECSDMQAWSNERQNFWNLLENVWGQYLNGQTALQQLKVSRSGTNRMQRILHIEDHHYKDLNQNPVDPAKVKHIEDELHEIISDSLVTN